jgi:hypothetical protein
MGYWGRNKTILAREGVAGEACEEPDYRAEDGAGKATVLRMSFKNGGSLPSRIFWDILGGP